MSSNYLRIWCLFSSLISHSFCFHQHNTEWIGFFSLVLLVSIPIFHFLCRRRINPFFLKFLFYSIVFFFVLFLGVLRDSLSYLFVFYVIKGPGHFESSLPAIDENSQFRGEAGASSSQVPEILNGVPVQWSDTVTYTSPRFLASSVYLPGELLDDPLTLERLSALNQLLLHIRYDFFNGVHDATFVKPLQLELDQTPPKLLPERLETIFWRERIKFYKNGDLLTFYSENSHSFFRG